MGETIFLAACTALTIWATIFSFRLDNGKTRLNKKEGEEN